MSIATFSDKQTVDSSTVTRVTLFREAKNLLVETKAQPVKVHGEGVFADAAMLNDLRDKEQLTFLVHEK